MTDKKQTGLPPRSSAPRRSGASTRRACKRLPAAVPRRRRCLERYVMHFGGVTTATAAWRCSATSSTCSSRRPRTARPIRDIVGEDPVEFAEALIRNYRKAATSRASRTACGARSTRAGEARASDDDAPAPAISVQGLEKSFGDVHVLRGVDFDVARGSIFALLGSNGAGKTTVVKILSTLLKADAGSASVDGFDVGHPGARGAGVHQPHGSVRCSGRDPHRAGEPGACRQAAPPRRPRRHRGRPPGPLRARRRWRQARRQPTRAGCVGASTSR